MQNDLQMMLIHWSTDYGKQAHDIGFYSRYTVSR